MEEQGNVKVVCRFRPLNDKELQTSESLCVNFLDDHTVSIHSVSPDQHKFTFDQVFAPSSSQESVYTFAARPIVDAVLEGFNGTVFAYGQTSSGKTFTMTGPDVEDLELMGIIPRMVQTVFDTIRMSDDNIEFSVKVAYCEIYLEKIKDLLDISKVNLSVHEDKTRGVYIEGLTERYVGNENEVFELMHMGLDNREVAYTNMNAGSSRSHSIFVITIGQTNSLDYMGKVGKLYLVDLAGSEKVGKTGAAGKRLDEAKNINKSLTALGHVINSLTDGKSTHVPYRDSKLTRVLQDSLGGNSKTSLIVTCSPSPYNEAETISTLRFGIRAKSIKNKPKINKEYTLAEMKLLLAKSEEEIEKRNKIIQKLEERLRNSGNSEPEILLSVREGFPERINYDEIMEEISELKNKLNEQTERNKNEKEKNKIVNSELQSCNLKINRLEAQLNQMYGNLSTCESTVKEQEALIEKLVINNENLQAKIEATGKNNLILDKLLTEKDAEIKHLKLELTMRPGTVAKSDTKKIQNMQSELEHERENCEGLTKKIAELESMLDTVLRQSDISNNSKMEQNYENLLRREKETWEKERSGFLRDLGNRVNKVIELEVDLDNLRDAYKILEKTLGLGEKALIRKNDALEKSLEQLINGFQKITMQNDKFICDIRYFEGKIREESDQSKHLRDKCLAYDIQIAEYQDKIKMLEDDARLISSSRNRASITGNIRKYVRKGADNSLRTSSIFQIPEDG